MPRQGPGAAALLRSNGIPAPTAPTSGCHAMTDPIHRKRESAAAPGAELAPLLQQLGCTLFSSPDRRGARVSDAAASACGTPSSCHQSNNLSNDASIERCMRVAQQRSHRLLQHHKLLLTQHQVGMLTFIVRLQSLALQNALAVQPLAHRSQCGACLAAQGTGSQCGACLAAQGTGSQCGACLAAQGTAFQS